MKISIELKADGLPVVSIETPNGSQKVPTSASAPSPKGRVKRKKAPPQSPARAKAKKAARAKAKKAAQPIDEKYLEAVAAKLTAEPKRAEELNLPGEPLTARRALAKLVEGGVAVKEGKARGTTYRLAS